MTDTLPVHINRERIHSVEAPAEVTVTGPFVLEMTNHGAAAHVHLHLDDALSRIATLEAANHYVDADGVRPVTVRVADDADPVEGTIEVVTGYGQERATIDVSVEDPTDEPVVVDEGLDRRASATAPDTGGIDLNLGHDLDAGSVAVLGAVVVVLGALAMLISDVAAVVIGVLAAVIAVGAAVYLLQAE